MGKEAGKGSKTPQEEGFGKNLSTIPVEFRKIMLNYGVKIPGKTGLDFSVEKKSSA